MHEGAEPEAVPPEPAKQRLLDALGSLWFQVPAVLSLHSVLWTLYFRLGQLGPRDYAAPTLVPSLVSRPELVTFLVLNFGLLLLAWRRLSWASIDARRRTRWFVFVAAAILVWAFSTYDLNLYFAQTHLADRLVLLSLLALLLVHPAFVVPLLTWLLLLALQLHLPLPWGNWIWPDKRLPLDCLVLFNAYLAISAVRRSRFPYLFLWLVLCLTGGAYSHAAIQKILLGPEPWTWLLENRLSNLIVSSYGNGGWLRFLGDDGIVAFARLHASVDRPMALLTLVLELAGLAILLHPRATRLALAGFVVLHAGILVASGIFFWKWILFDLALLAYHSGLARDAGFELSGLWRRSPAVADGAEPPAAARAAPVASWSLYSRRLALLSVLVIAGSRLYFHNIPFAWYDTRLCNYFTLYGVGVSGARYRVEPRFFSPYDMLFQQSRFYYLVERPVLVGTFGTTSNPAIVRALDNARVEEVPALVAKLGRRWHNAASAATFRSFVQRFVHQAMRRRSKFFWMNYLAPPYHFQTSAASDAYDFEEPLEKVEVEFEERFYDGSRWHQVSRELVQVIPLQ